MKHAIVLLFIMGFSRALCALPKVAVFAMPAESPPISAQISETHQRVLRCFEMLGRFEIVEQSLISRAWADSEKDVFYDRCIDSARASGASLVVLLSSYQAGSNSFGEAVLIPLDADFSSLKKNIRVRTRIMRNVPYLVEREIALLHQTIPLYYIAEQQGNEIIIDAGSRSGLSPGTYPLQNGRLSIRRVNQRTALVEGIKPGKGIILVYPRIKDYLTENSAAIDEGINYRFGPGYAYMRGGGAEKRYIQSILVINPVGNLLLPGYSSWLSANYVGIEGPKPSYPTMGVGASLYLYHLLWMPVTSGFKENFFPFIDGSKTDAQKRYHTWLWATIPVNFTVCYFDHLALQYRTKNLLPPFFENHNSNAALLSLIVPGGGHFYKGDRMAGWGYYAGEYALFSYGIYHYDDNRGKQILAAAGALKIIDIVHAFIAKPSYDFYNREYYRKETTSFFADTVSDPQGDLSFLSGLTLHF